MMKINCISAKSSRATRIINKAGAAGVSRGWLVNCLNNCIRLAHICSRYAIALPSSPKHCFAACY